MSGTGTGPAGGEAGIRATFTESSFAVKALLFGVLVNKLGAFMQVYLVLFMTSRGFTDVQGGLALAAYGVGSVLGVLLGGGLTDRLGARWTIAAGMSSTAVLLVAVLHVRLYPALLAAVALVGMISQVYRPAAATVLSQATPRHRQVMVFAMYRLALNLGTTAAPLLGALLLSVSYNLLFYGEAVAALGYAVVALFALPPRPAATGSPDPAAGAAKSSGGYLKVLADRRYAAYLLAMLLNAAVYIQYLSTLPLAMRDAHLSTVWYGAVVALNGAVVICFELLMTKVVQHWRMRTVLTVGFVLLGSGMALYALPGGPAVFVVGTLLWTLAEIVEGPTMFAYPGMAGPPESSGRYIGAAHAMFGIGSAVGPAAGVLLWSGMGQAAWVLIGATSVLALVPAWYGIGSVGAAASGGGASEEGAGEAADTGDAAAAEAAG
ncbi:MULTISPECIES: MFS transporter [unclassified Streptomyces]|uniref:MFS transporter n=1 Tax=unclassified Streptomyces TaxID=2593676 RepID=UPI002E2CFDBB|nr:MFS transporter [Streptomyces sp. NBC_00223]